MIRITIPGKPVAKKRPRFARIGKGVRTYSDQQTDEGRFLLFLQASGYQAMSGPLSVDLEFVLPRPKSHYGTGRNSGKLKRKMLDALPVSKPDVDNFAKFTLDVCNGILWRDDAAVVHLRAFKRYGVKPRTIIQIESAAPHGEMES
ncbi:MAG: RusA family crossover junction endodeoxyribonuclease [Clostridiales bacterium]|jgi:Holliday junction resolvase RusA-like endonuclease|nr:RusA family crossover junction endodeoxyribonuclease [Clostridiales bacterium]